MRWRICALGLLAVVSCKPRPTGSHAPNAASASAAAASGAGLASGQVSRHGVGAGAFDLVTTEGGAALVWAPDGGAELWLSLLDEQGAERRREPLFRASGDASAAPTGSRIAEVAAVARRHELAVAWLEQTGGAARSRAIVRAISDSGSAPRVLEIGAVLTPVSTPRGNLAISSTNERFLVLSRGKQDDCVDATEHDCVEFGFHRLEASSASAQGLPLSVPLPCDQNSVSFAVAGSRWYYGVCSRATGKSVTTLFSIQTEPEYARADRILDGCLPLGALAQGGDLLVVGDCGGERRGVRVRGGNAETSDLRVDRLDAVCDAGHPLLHQLGPSGLSLSLDGPRDRLEAFLPPNLAAAASRAAWTGQTLLVAQTSGGKITLKGYQCDSTLLREVPLAALARR